MLLFRRPRRNVVCLALEPLDARCLLSTLAATEPLPAVATPSVVVEPIDTGPQFDEAEVVATGALIVVPADPTREEMIDAIIKGGHPQQHPDDWDEADLNNDGKIEGETETEILEGLIDQVMDDAEAAGDKKDLERGRKGWYDKDSGRIVIYDPKGPGTAFIPDNPSEYWKNLK